MAHRTGRRSVAAMAVVLALLGAACGDDDGDAQASTVATSADTSSSGMVAASTVAAAADDDVCTAERRGGTLTVGTGAPFTSMDPTLIPGGGNNGADFMSAMFDTLMRYDAPTGEYEPNVAESLEPNADLTEWTLTLRPDVRFGNGDPLTTEDVRFNIERMQASRVRAAGMVQEISAMTIVDDRTMVFDVSTPWGGFPYVLAAEPGWIASKRVIEERGDAFATNPTGAGVGPFEFSRFAEGEEILLVAKDDYWGGPVCIETLRFVNIPGPDAPYEAFSNGELDTVFLSSLPAIARARDDDVIRFERPVGTEQYVVADQGISGRGPTPFQDVRVREAMQLAIDYTVLDERLYEGLSGTTSAIVPSSSPLYHGLDGPPHDPERAAALVADTKADGTWDGSFTFLQTTSPDAAELGVLLEAMWEAVGMDVTLEAVPNAFQRVALERNFEVSTIGFAMMEPAPWSTVNSLASDNPRQRSGYANAEMDAALEDLRASATLEETRAALADMQRVWNETFPLINIKHGIRAIVAGDHVHGLEYGPDVTPYFHRVWVEG